MEMKPVTTRFNTKYYDILSESCKENGISKQFVLNKYLKDGLIKDGLIKEDILEK